MWGLIPRPSLSLLSRGLPADVYLRHTAALLGRVVALLALAVVCAVVVVTCGVELGWGALEGLVCS